ncbi:MAG: hypothetical protein HOQ02_04410 [Lysobacter sp.]|nr:hypothetical protein [Lysobacter sp.]
MSGIRNENPHPSSLSDAERAELNKLVEEDEAGGDADTDTDAGDKGKKEEAAAGGNAANAAAGDTKNDAASRAAGEPDAAAAEDGKDGDAPNEGEGDKVDRRQLDGVLRELRETRAELKSVKAQVAPAREALPPRDFDVEDKALDDKVAALDKRYDEVGDLSDEEYRRELRAIETERRSLDRDRNRYELLGEIDKRQQAAAEEQAKVVQADAEAAWKTDVKGWEENLGAWLKNPVRRATVEQTMATMNADPETAGLSNTAYLAKLDGYLSEAFDNYPRKGAGAAQSDAKADQQANEQPVNARQQQAARRAAEVAGSPPAVNGGVGNRGTVGDEVNVEGMKLGQFGKLSKAKQNEALGLPPDAK